MKTKGRPSKTDTNKKKLLEALEKTLGVVTTACKIANVARSTYYEYYNNDDEFAKDVDEFLDMAIDFAESQLHKQIKNGSVQATTFYLKTKGKKRGYVEKQEIEVDDKRDFKELSTEELLKRAEAITQINKSETNKE